MTEPQQTIAKELTACGDYYVVTVRIEFPNEKRLMIVPYHRLVESPKWTNTQLREWPRIESEKKYDLQGRFSKDFHRHIDTEWYL